MTDSTHADGVQTLERDNARKPYHFFQQYSELFKQSLSNEKQAAYDRWGYSMLFSLSDEDAARQLPQIGYALKDGLDHYNQGCVLAQEEDYEGARKAFQHAVEADPALSEAQFNLALALEKLGKGAEARKAWEAHLQRHPDESGRAEIEARIAELGK